MRNSAKKYLPLIILSAIILTFGIVFFVFYFLPSGESNVIADNYTVTSYYVEVVVNEDNSYDVLETITVNFSEPKHGIYRYLPIYQTMNCQENDKIYSVNYKVAYSDLYCSDYAQIYTSDGNLVLQIGNETQTLLGPKTYTISYKLFIGDDKIDDFDQFYYNFIGSWDTTISNISLNVTFTKPIDQTSAFVYAADSPEEEINIMGNVLNYSYSGVLPAFSAVTVRTVLENDYFTTVKASIVPDILFIVGGVLILGLITLWIWKKNNNNRIIPVVEFRAPNGITPADAGYLIDKIVNRKDISSLIVYWANKGFVKIIDNGGNDCQIEKLNDADSSFKDYEKEIFDAFFKTENSVSLGGTNESVAVAVNNARNSIKYENQAKNFVSSRDAMRTLFGFVITVFLLGLFTYLGEKLALYNFSLMIRLIFTLIISLGIILLVIAKEIRYSIDKFMFIILNTMGAVLILGIISYIAVLTFDMYSNPLMLSIFVPLLLFASIYLILMINARTDQGNKMFGSLIGLRQFILITERDRIKMLVEKDPSLFYDILPYAYVLGVSDVWINKFDGLLVGAPSWYEGNNGNIFFGYYLLSTMNRTNNFYTRSLVKINSNKSGGLGGGRGFGSGGGFSGGGFGGGGGGSW